MQCTSLPRLGINAGDLCTIAAGRAASDHAELCGSGSGSGSGGGSSATSRSNCLRSIPRTATGAVASSDFLPLVVNIFEADLNFR